MRIGDSAEREHGATRGINLDMHKMLAAISINWYRCTTKDSIMRAE
jgi:hypothetical protein